MTTTFVTAFCLIENYKVPEKTIEGYFNHFTLLAKTGINLAVYISQCLKEQLLNIIKDYPNVKLIDVIDVQDTWIYKNTIVIDHLNLPPNRNELKDSYEYMVMQNSKLQFCHDVIQLNPFNTNYFAWIDFGIFHVLKNINASTKQLQLLANKNYITSNVIFPGCWPKGYDYLNQVNWRFCGGFFIGYKNALLDMWQRYQIFLLQFIKKYNVMVWEVNLWHALEIETNWSPIQYQADHNDTIICVPSQYYR